MFRIAVCGCDCGRGLVKDGEESEGLGGDYEGMMNFSDFLLVELTFLFICSARLCQYWLCPAPLKQHSNKRRLISQSLYTPFLVMLFLLFLYYLLQGPSTDAGPILTIEDRSLAGNHCNDLAHCRTIWNIVWSCLVTIFSCTWVAVHPNVPCPKKREASGWIERYIWNPLLSFMEHRLPLFLCALFVPEYVLAWAIRQFLKARRIAKSEFELCVKYLFINSNNSK